MKKKTTPALVIHAGAGKQLGSHAREERARVSLLRIVDEAFDRLMKKMPAVEVVAWAVSELENDAQFNAGTGAKLQKDGNARLTASLMDGKNHRFSGVLNVEKIKNPIFVAKNLQFEKDRVLAGDGAMLYARAHGFGTYNPVTEETWSEWKRKSSGLTVRNASPMGTVGAVALDLHGDLAAATSTGGKGMEIVGRASDSGTVAGNYASKKCAISCTGVGEEIVEWALASRIVTRVDDAMTLQGAFRKTFKEFKQMGGRAGAIGVDFRGQVEVATTTPCILHAIRTPTQRRGYP